MFSYGLILYLCLTGSFFKYKNINKKSKIQMIKKNLLLILLPNKNDIIKSNNKYEINKLNSDIYYSNKNQKKFTKADKLQELDSYLIINESISTIIKLLNINPKVRPRAGAILNSYWLTSSIEIEKQFPSINSLFY